MSYDTRKLTAKVASFRFRAPDRTVGEITATPPNRTTMRLDVHQLDVRLGLMLDNLCVGYAYALRQNGQYLFNRSGGSARRAEEEEGFQQFDADTIMTIASAGKVITGFATVRVLDDAGMSLDDTIGPWLPKPWTVGPGVKEITFCELLTHTSGLGEADFASSNPDDFASLHTALNTGVAGRIAARWFSSLFKTPSTRPAGRVPAKRVYKNLNFILLRILVANILDRTAFMPQSSTPPDVTRPPTVNPPIITPPGASADDFDNIVRPMSVKVFNEFVHNKLFNPAGVTAELSQPPQCGRHYRWPYDGLYGEAGNIEKDCGSGGWYMSSAGLLDTLGAVRRGGLMLSPSRAAETIVLGLGWDDVVDSPLGPIAIKGGLSMVPPFDADNPNLGRRQGTVIVLLPAGMELVIFVNSNVGNDEEIGGETMNAILQNIRPWNPVTGFDYS